MSSQAGASAAGDIISALTGGIFGLIGTGMTNASNEGMNNANIALQRELNAEQMSRYDQAFEYQKALQERLFEREDTAISRQAQDMANVGLNPLSQQMNGLGAGQGLNPPSQPSLSAPQNTFSMQNVVAGALEGMNALANLNTQGIQRDKLRAEENFQRLVNESQKIDNLIKANKNGISIDEDGNLKLSKNFRQEQDIVESSYQNAEATRRRNEREDAHQAATGSHDLMSQAGRTATDIVGMSDKTLDALDNATDKSENIVGKILGSSINQKLNKVERQLNPINYYGKQAGKKAGAWIKDKTKKLFSR